MKYWIEYIYFFICTNIGVTLYQADYKFQEYYKNRFKDIPLDETPVECDDGLG